MKIQRKINPEQGERFKACLKYANMTQTELASKSYISQQTISKIVQNKVPLSAENALVFAKHLKVRHGYLLCLDQYMTNDERDRAIIALRLNVASCSEALLRSLGYEIIDMEQKEDGSCESIHRPHKHVVVSITDTDEEILQKAHSAFPVRVLMVKKPDGSISEIGYEEYRKTLRGIEDYAAFLIEENCDREKCGINKISRRKDKGF